MEVDGETLIPAGWGLASRFPTWSPLTSQVGETFILSGRNENPGFLLGFLWHHSGGNLVSSEVVSQRGRSRYPTQPLLASVGVSRTDVLWWSTEVE